VKGIEVKEEEERIAESETNEDEFPEQLPMMKTKSQASFVSKNIRDLRRMSQMNKDL